MSGIMPQLWQKGGEDVSTFVTTWPGMLIHSKWRTGYLEWTQHGPCRAHENILAWSPFTVVFCYESMFFMHAFSLALLAESIIVTWCAYVISQSNHVTSSKRADTLICHTTMRRNLINFLYNSGHVTLWCVEVGPVVNAQCLGEYKTRTLPS